MAQDKHTIYIDIDDEITAIIDKVTNAPGKIVALVLPKRATVLQSIVNMKLLKKSALSSKKSLVLITSEAGLMPLAGAVGLHVAKSLQSKPMIPLAPDHGDSDDAVISEDSDEPAIDPMTSVGVLAAGIDDDGTETIELDEADDADTAATPTDKSAKKSKFSVPNFERFRTSFFLAIVVVILLVVGWVFAAIVLPKANVVIKTDTSTTVSNISFTADTALKDLDVSKALVPAVQKEIKKTDTEKTTATGKKDTGAPSTGTITIKNCEDSNTRSVAAGTVFSAGGKNYTSNEAISLPAGTFSGGGSNCTTTSVSVGVTAADRGTSYNQDAGTYTSSSSALSGNFRISGSAMTGGTSNVVTVVNQDDIDAAVTKMAGRLDNAAKKELGTQLQTDELKALDETLIISPPVITSTPAVGAEATEVTITKVSTYTIVGVKQDYINELIKEDVGKKIDITKQGILDNGLTSATFRLTNRKSPTEALISMQTLVVAGPKLNAESIKNEIIGKKRGDAIKLISSKPGVKDVTISYSPFWVYSTPKAAKKITVTIDKPAVKKPAATSTSSTAP